ncbi:protein containing a domain related to multimeric flavodoxin WrbA family [Lachnospiraceae bacterium KM106-2]|nr:protein containing a domain related to multimeric flavodoxin WrbA family [Lachnospiraceae bacterium KM106-2]
MNKEQLAIIRSFYEHNEIIKDLTKEERDTLITVAFQEGSDTRSSEVMNQVATILYHSCFAPDITLEEVWELYWNLQVILFRYNEVTIKDGDIRYLYHYIFESISNIIPNQYPYREIEEREEDTIVIVTSQMLSTMHAPTIRVLDYAYTLQHDLGKKVIIVNDAGMHYYLNENLNSNFQTNYLADYEKSSKISYKDEMIEYIQNPVLMPNISVIQQLIDIIYQLNPSLVYNIGGSSVVADYCSYFTTTASLPCSYKIPVSCSRYLLVGRKLRDQDQATIDQTLDYQRVLETEINYQYRVTAETYTREQFHISEASFLIGVIGNRLDVEINQEFIEYLNTLLNEIPQCEIALVGRVNDEERIINQINDKKRIHILGFLPGASECIGFCDLYLNPIRSGGGRSCFDAMYKGVPILTLPIGDVSHTCGEDFMAADYDEMLVAIRRYVGDNNFLEQQRQLVKQRADEIADMKGTLSAVINKIMEIERGNK